MVKQLVEEPELVSVSFVDQGEKISVTVRVGQADLKRAIGREGRVARALQSCVSAFEPKRQVDVSIDVAS